MVINISEDNFELNIKNADDFTLKLLNIYIDYKLKKNEQTQVIVEQTPLKSEQTPLVVEQKPEIVEQKKPQQGKTSGYSWTQAEDQILIDNIKKYSFREIFDKNLLLGRTRSAIENRVNRLGVRKTKYKKIQVKESKGNLNFTGKVLTTHWVPVYEQCFNHLVFKLGDRDFFKKIDIFKILRKWYCSVFNYDLYKKRETIQDNHIYSYLRYGREHGFFEKIHFGKYRVIKKEEKETAKRVVEPVVSNKPPVTDENKPTITIVGIDDRTSPPVKGFTQHMQNRIKEIDERRRQYESSITKEKITTEEESK